MTLPINVRPDPDQPIPGGPFYFPPSYTLQGTVGPLVVGDNLSVSADGVISATSGGSITGIFAGPGISVVTNLAGQITISNTGALSLIAGTGIAVSGATGNITISTIGVVTGVTGSTPVVVTGTTTPNISVSAATTLAPGVVQLNNTVTSTSTTVAATANAVKTAYDAGVLGQTNAAAAQTTANAALPLVGGVMSGNIAFAGTQTFPVSGIQAASTTQVGVVQLYNGTNSVSDTLALTAAQGKSLQDQIDALSVTSNVTLAGTLDASTGFVDSVTAAGTAAGFVAGSPLPAAAAGNTDYFVIADVPAASYTPPGGSATQVHVGDWFLSSGTSWQFLNVGYQAPAASLTTQGIVQLEDSVTSTSVATAAVPNSVKTAYDAAVTAQTAAGAAQTDATQALTDSAAAQTDATQALSDAAAAQIDATQALADAAAAQATADAALPKAGGLMTGDLTFSGAGNGVVFDNASTVEAISDSTSTTSSSTAASSTAVKSAKDAAATAQTDATQALADAAAAQVTADAAIPKSTITAIGDLIVGDGVATYSALEVGSDNQVLTADSTCANGLKWGAAGGTGTVTCVCTGTGLTGGPITGIGTISLTDTGVAIGTYQNATVVVDAQGRLTSAAEGATPVVRNDYPAKGALLTATVAGTTVAIPVGTNNQVLTADSACTEGLKWGDAPVTCSAYTDKGVLLTATAADTPVAITVGSDNQVLTADSTCANGLKWAAAGGGGGSPATPTAAGIVYGCTETTLNNAALGFNALVANTTGNCNTAIGSRALFVNNTGSSNTATGVNALLNNTFASRNTATGHNALCCNTSGCSNVATGYSAMLNNTTGNYNTATGVSSLVSNTTGNCNTATGFNALFANTTGFGNIGTGPNALRCNTTGSWNTATGISSLVQNSTGCCNTAYGSCALPQNNIGIGNTATGSSSLLNNSTGCFNTAVGVNAGCSITTGCCNTAIGYGAGNNATTGVNNIVIGYNAQLSSATVSNEITLGNASTNCIRAAVQTISILSDARDKTDVQDLALGLEFIRSVRPVKFTWQMREESSRNGQMEVGFIAQELLAAEEEAGVRDYLGLVSTGNPERFEATPGKLFPIMVQAIKELSDEVRELKTRLQTLEGN